MPLKRVSRPNIPSIVLVPLFLLLCACPRQDDSPPVFFYEKELKGLLDRSKEEYSPGLDEIRRPLNEHITKKRPPVSIEGVDKRDLIRVRVDTGYTFRSLVDRLKTGGPLTVLRPKKSRPVIDTPSWQIQFERHTEGIFATFILDKERGTQISPRDFFARLRR